MSEITEIWVERSQLRNVKASTRPAPALEDGQVLAKIDKFGLTANNVSYAFAGDMIGYWNFFPAEGEWGNVPVWGFADVIESRSPEISVGERLWGYFPIASHLVLQPGEVYAGGFTDMAAHRSELPGLYNQYTRTSSEPDAMKAIENERCVLFPLFTTSYVLTDYLVDNDFFGAGQVLIGSVSSKTGLGLASFLQRGPKGDRKVVGLTSPRNVDFVERLGVCDQIVAYGDEDQIDASIPAAFVDMSGDGPLQTKLHTMLGDNMVESCSVGATHWEAGPRQGDLPGAEPKFFFAPAQIEKRDAEWGRGVLMRRAFDANAEVAASIKGDLKIEKVEGAEAAQAIWRDLLDNNVAPSRGLVVSL